MFILGVNVDHIATLRNARNEGYPDLIEMTLMAQKAGAHQITAHLREDRRHIKDQDMLNLKKAINIPLNMEMAATQEMVDIALNLKPHQVCLVPEKREEVTTEGGLNLENNWEYIQNITKIFRNNDIKVSLFLDPKSSYHPLITKIAPNSVEINTGSYANAEKSPELQIGILKEISNFAIELKENGINIHAGHGLNLNNIESIAKISQITEFNIGHFLISYALKVGFTESIKQMLQKIASCR